MSPEDKKVIENLVKSVDRMRDDVDKALVIRSNDTPPSFSQVVNDMNKKLDEQKEIMAEHMRAHDINDRKWDAALLRMEPYLKRSEDDLEFRQGLERRGVIASKWAGIWLTFAAVIGSIYYGVKHIK